ncbi:MAG: hypothetical protein J7M19_09570, partial [Planctomycetes bacterium]|nr:hypothetical protein [Planctomycetota bacterium]
VHRQRPFDLVITSSPPESMHLIGLKLKSARPCRWLTDFCDGWTFEPLREEGLLPLRSKIERIMEAVVVRRADFITAATRPIASDLTRRYLGSHGKVMWLPPAFEEFHTTTQAPERSRFHLVYTGRFSGSHRRRTPSVFFKGLAAALEKEPEMAEHFRLTLMGDFSEEERALWGRGKVAEVVTTFSPVAYEKAVELSASATMLLLVTAAGATSTATRKLFDYLSVKRPIFALAAGNEAARIVNETRSGICVSSSDPAAVAEGLVHVFGLWRSKRLESAFPGDRNDLYLAAPHLERTLGKVLASLPSETALTR